MKFYLLVSGFLLSFSAMACPDLSGSYLDSNEESVILAQKGCEEVTVLSRPLSHTLKLNNEYVLVREDMDTRAHGRGMFQDDILIIEVKVEYKRNPGIPRKLLPVRAVNRYTKNIEGSLIEMSSIYNDSNNVLANSKTIYRKQ